MRHSRFEHGFTRRRKVRAMSDAAFRLWVCAIDYAAEHRTDGVVTDSDLDEVPNCPRGRRRAQLVAELESLRAFEAMAPGTWYVHDFLQWQKSSAALEEIARRSRERMATVRANTPPVLARTEAPCSREHDPDVRPNTDACSPELRATRAQVSPSGSDLSSPSEASVESDRLRAREAEKPRVRGRERKAPLTVIAEPWPLTDEHRKYAIGKGWPAWWLENRHENFCDLAVAKSWKYSEWNRAFYTYLRGEIGYQRGPTELAHLAPGKSGTPTSDQLRARRARDEADRLERERQAKLESEAAGGPSPTAEQVRQLALGVVGS